MSLTKATYSMIKNAPINIVDLGADSTGLVDSTSTIQEAIDQANVNGGGTVYAPVGTYTVGTLVMKSNVLFSCESGATFNKIAGVVSDNNNVFNLYGSTTATSSILTADVALASLSVNVTSASGFAAGDWCLLQDSVYVSGSAGRNQEIVKIASIASLTVTLEAATIGSYATASSAQLVKITPVENAIVENAVIVVPTGAATGGGIATYLAVNSDIKNCQIYGANDNASIGIVTSYNISVHGNSCYDNQNISSGGYGYAYSIDNSHHVRLSNNHQEHVRESLATNRSRFITFTGNTSNYSYDSHFNTHGSKNSYIVISNNTCSGQGGIGYAVGYSGHGAGDSYVTISNNVSSGVNVCVAVGGASGKENIGLIISGNVASNCATTGAFSPITLVYANDSSVIGNVIDGNNNTNISNGIIALNCANVQISANKVSNIPNGYGIVLNTSTNCMVTGNYTSNITAADYRSVSACTGSRISENVSDISPTISIGSDVTTANNSWQSVSYASAEPTTGTYIRGAIVYNNAPSSAGYVGWVCTSSGTPGTWKTFGLIS